MFQRLSYFLKLVSATNAYKRSDLPKRLELSNKARLVSARLRAHQSHFLFTAKKNNSDQNLLVKFVTIKNDESLAKEVEAFEILESINTSKQVFKYPTIYGYEPNGPFLVMDYLRFPTVFDTLKVDRSPETFALITSKTIAWQRALYAATEQSTYDWKPKSEIETFLALDAIGTLPDDNRLFFNSCREFLIDLAGSVDGNAIPLTFVHGDFHTQNLLWDGTDIYAIDFSRWQYAMPEFDLSRSALNGFLETHRTLGEVCTDFAAQHGALDPMRLEYLTIVRGVGWMLKVCNKRRGFNNVSPKVLEQFAKIASLCDLTLPENR